MRRRRSTLRFSVTPPTGAGSIKHKWIERNLDALIERAAGSCAMPESERASRRTEGGSWYGGYSWAKALETAKRGDVSGAERLKPAIVAGINKLRMSMGRLDPVYRLDEGRWIDVARYVKGEPECWGDMVSVDEPTLKKTINVVLNTCVSSYIEASAVDTAGAEIGGAVLGLQSLGYVVNLYLAVKNRVTDSWICGAPVNPGGAPLDVARLSAVLRPWFFRRIIFSLWETAVLEMRQQYNISSGAGYGHVGQLTVAEVEEITGSKDAVILDLQALVAGAYSAQTRLLHAMGTTTKGAI